MKKKIFLFWMCITVVFFSAAQNVGIGSATPLARLHVTDSAVLFTGNISAPPLTTTINPPVQGAGTRMFWFPALGAFRAGNVDGVQWNRDSIGQLSFAAGYNTKAKGRFSVALGNNSTASGNQSFSMGSSLASGEYATSFGANTFSSGNYSTTFGNFTKASGELSFATGANTIASGNISFTAGYETVAKAAASFAAGSYNDDTDNPIANTPAPADRIFQIGNGTVNTKRNALTLLRNGNMGIGTANPAARLHVTDSAVVFTGTSLDAAARPPVEGAGYRMMWFPQRIAFRVGGVTTPNWDRDSIGYGSFASGFNTKATGNYSTAMGFNTTASDGASTAMGFSTTASGYISTAMGLGTSAKAYNSLSIGGYNDDSDNPFPLIASLTDRIFQIGNGTSSTRSNALTVLRNGFIGIGTTQPNAELQFTNNLGYRKMVLHERANNNNEYVGLGFISNEFVYQTSATAEDHVFYAATGPGGSTQLLRIKGNGNVGVGAGDAEYRLDVNGRMRIRSGGDLLSSAGTWLNNTANNASPAFIGMESDDGVGFYGNTTPNGWGLVMKIGTGNVGIGTSSPAAKLHVMGSILATGTITPSDSRYKKNIKPIGNALGKLQLLNGVTYTMNSAAFAQWQFDETLQYGLIAQNVEKVFPEMVKTIDANGYKGVDYVKLIPVLIESIKQQQQQIEILKTENKEIKQLLSKSRL